ncbi:AraC family transcriptional regulator [Evansella tamaricis]|uniref:AraC family transcriptional regulator n=1 Tax=Evansella tamaricis TaxID=2069301 RepID=A0ABS6JGL7_9BACI|nr:AraC family transcriptional regulator [Evansella tamaricis]MBU9711458.1 AraC family transcriptional regulator [Evansella tamaricis]
MDTLLCKIPPLPIFIKGGIATFRVGEKHFQRVFHIFDLIYVVEGKLYMKEDDVEYEITKGMYIILAPGKKHGGYMACDVPTKYYWIHFDLPGKYNLITANELDWSKVLVRDNTFTEAAQFKLHLPRMGSFHSTERAEEGFIKVVSLDDSNDPADKIKQQLFFNDLLIQLQQDVIEVPTSARTVSDEIINYIHKHYKDHEFTVKKMAKELLYHPDYLTRSLKKVIGMTPVQYLNYYRLSVAKRKLVNEHKDLITIANECGFSDVSYFSRTFKKREGTTPGEYRRMRGSYAKQSPSENNVLEGKME